MSQIEKCHFHNLEFYSKDFHCPQCEIESKNLKENCANCGKVIDADYWCCKDCEKTMDQWHKE